MRETGWGDAALSLTGFPPTKQKYDAMCFWGVSRCKSWVAGTAMGVGDRTAGLTHTCAQWRHMPAAPVICSVITPTPGAGCDGASGALFSLLL